MKSRTNTVMSGLLVLMLLAIGQVARADDPPPVPEAPEVSADNPGPALEEVLDAVEARLLALDDIEFLVNMELIDPADGSVIDAQARFIAYLPIVFRVAYLKPDMFADTILVVDQNRNEAQQYHPITEQIIVQPWDRMAQERGVDLDFERWIGLPDRADFTFEALGTETAEDGTLYYVLSAQPDQLEDSSLFKFWINTETWLVKEMELYNPDGILTFRARMQDVVLNQGVTEARVREMPKEAKKVFR